MQFARNIRYSIIREIVIRKKLYVEGVERRVADYNLLNIENTHKRLKNDLDTVSKYIQKLEDKTE